MERYVALLRGVNVGGKNKILMTDLASLFQDLECRSITTYIQSGNVIFSADAKTAAKANHLICGNIKEQFGFQTTIVLRSQTEIARIEKANPFVNENLPAAKLYVMFLAERPSAKHLSQLGHNRSQPDQFTVIGSEIFLCLSNDAAVTKLTNAYFDAKLKTVSTMRNWRTVQKLSELMRARP